MSFTSPIGANNNYDVAPAGRPMPRIATAAPRPVAAPQDRAEFQLDPVPETMPPELHGEITAAAQVIDMLHEQERELRFEVDDVTGRVRIELRDLEGNVVREIPPNEALNIAAALPPA